MKLEKKSRESIFGKDARRIQEVARYLVLIRELRLPCFNATHVLTYPYGDVIVQHADRNYELSLETINDIYPFKKGIAVGDIVRSRLQHPEMAFQGEVLGFEESTGRVIVISTHRNKHTDRCRYAYKPDELEVISRGRHQSDVNDYQEYIEQFEFKVGESYVVNESYIMNLREIDTVGNLCLFSVGDSFMKVVYPSPKNLREANIRKLQRF